jgi:ElaA protein
VATAGPTHQSGPADELGLHEAHFDELDPGTLYEILRLRVDVFVVEQACAFGDLDGRDREPGCVHLWIERGGAVVGCLRLLPEPDGSVQIGRVVTHPSVRGDGVGARLMRAALDRIDRGTLSSSGDSVLKAQSRVADWYAHFGFVVDGDEFLEDDIPHVPMRRSGPA